MPRGFYVHVAGRDDGPFDVAQIRAMVASGEIDQKTSCRFDEADQWSTLHELNILQAKTARPISPTVMVIGIGNCVLLLAVALFCLLKWPDEVHDFFTSAASIGLAIGIGLVLLISAIVVYFLPSILAFTLKHHQRQAILVLNIIAGWTFLGWVVAMVWSQIKPPPHSNAQANPPQIM